MQACRDIEGHATCEEAATGTKTRRELRRRLLVNDCFWRYIIHPGIHKATAEENKHQRAKKKLFSGLDDPLVLREAKTQDQTDNGRYIGRGKNESTDGPEVNFGIQWKEFGKKCSAETLQE